MLLEGPDPNKRWNEGMESSDSRSELRTDADINCSQIVELFWGSRTKHITSGLHVFTHVWRRFSPGTAVWLDRKISTYKIQCFPGETRRAESMMIKDVSPRMFWWGTWVRNQSHLPDNQSIFQVSRVKKRRSVWTMSSRTFLKLSHCLLDSTRTCGLSTHWSRLLSACFALVVPLFSWSKQDRGYEAFTRQSWIPFMCKCCRVLMKNAWEHSVNLLIQNMSFLSLSHLLPPFSHPVIFASCPLLFLPSAHQSTADTTGCTRKRWRRTRWTNSLRSIYETYRHWIWNKVNGEEKCYT